MDCLYPPETTGIGQTVWCQMGEQSKQRKKITSVSEHFPSYNDAVDS